MEGQPKPQRFDFDDAPQEKPVLPAEPTKETNPQPRSFPMKDPDEEDDGVYRGPGWGKRGR